MVIPILKGSKGEDSKVFLKEYKKACIGTGLKIVVEWLINFFPKFTLIWITDRNFEKIMEWHN